MLQDGEGAFEESEPYGNSPSALLGSLFSLEFECVCRRGWGVEKSQHFPPALPQTPRGEGALRSALNTWYSGVGGCFRCHKDERVCLWHLGALGALAVGERGRAPAVGLSPLAVSSPRHWVTALRGHMLEQLLQKGVWILEALF